MGGPGCDAGTDKIILQPMTLTQLRAFLTASRTGSFSSAARQMAMTPASVSELVRRLEEESGMELFVRHTKGLELTAAGEELVPFAEQSVAGADSGAQALQSIGSLAGGVASFGLLRNAQHYRLSDLLQRFHERYPRVRARLVALSSTDIAAAVSSGELEAGLVVLPIEDEGLRVTPLLRDEVVYVSADPTHLHGPKTIEDLAAAQLILYDAHSGWRDPTRRQLGQRAQLAGVRIEPLLEVEHVEAAVALAASGAGDTYLPRAVTLAPDFPPVLGVVPFAERLHDTIALITRRSSVLSPPTRELARLAKDMLLASR